MNAIYDKNIKQYIRNDYMKIIFKNDSKIEVVKTREEPIRSQPKEFKIMDIHDYYRKYPDMLCIKLHWWQKLFFRMSLNKLKFYNKIIKW